MALRLHGGSSRVLPVCARAWTPTGRRRPGTQRSSDGRAGRGRTGYGSAALGTRPPGRADEAGTPGRSSLLPSLLKRYSGLSWVWLAGRLVYVVRKSRSSHVKEMREHPFPKNNRFRATRTAYERTVLERRICKTKDVPHYNAPQSWSVLLISKNNR